MQTQQGQTPSGLVSWEHGEWFRLVAVPAMQSAARQHFYCRPGHWFTRHADEALKCMKAKLHWDEAANGPLYWCARDHDSRHSMKDVQHFLAKKKEDKVMWRLKHKRGEDNWMQFEALQFVPSAQRVPDSIQCAIEMVVKVAKTAVISSLPDHIAWTWVDMQDAVLTAVPDKVTPDLVSRCWEHGTWAIRVFSALTNQTVRCEVHNTVLEVRGTDGGWVPKPVNG
jgi:hypothetical protein